MQRDIKFLIKTKSFSKHFVQMISLKKMKYTNCHQ